jgi:PEP-CTERM motif
VYSPLTSALNSGFSDPYSYALPLWHNFYLNFEMIDISPVYARDRQLRLAFADLPDIGGIVSIDPTNAFASECYNCGPDRLFVTGGTIAAVPETSTWAMLLIGFAAIGFAGYRRCHS